MTVVTRFAPSPTGYLHLGHAYSALFAYDQAQQAGGKFILRIEDIDPVRCKPEFIDGIYEDLSWLGVRWQQPARKQAQHMDDYAAALDHLRRLGVLYPCFCTRRAIAQEAAAAGHAPHGMGGAIYPGTCRPRGAGDVVSPAHADRAALSITPSPLTTGVANWRLDVTQALAITGALTWHDREAGLIAARPQDFGDVVLARKDVPTSYHLSVTVDDHRQGVSLVTRGDDLFRATDVHRLLQALLGYNVPDYHHHPLLTDESGRRYAKRDHSVTLRALRAEGVTPDMIREKLLSEGTE